MSTEFLLLLLRRRSRKRYWSRLVAYPIYRSVCLCVRKVYCGKTADSIRMPFGMVSGVGRGMDVLDGSRCPKGKGCVERFVLPLLWRRE